LTKTYLGFVVYRGRFLLQEFSLQKNKIGWQLQLLKTTIIIHSIGFHGDDTGLTFWSEPLSRCLVFKKVFVFFVKIKRVSFSILECEFLWKKQFFKHKVLPRHHQQTDWTENQLAYTSLPSSSGKERKYMRLCFN